MGMRISVGLTAVAAVLGAVAATATAQAPAPPPPTPPAPVPAPLPPGVVAPGVTIAGVSVGGLTRRQATAAVLQQVVAPKRRPLVATFRGRRLPINPVAAGYRADVAYAVRAALLFGRARPVPAPGVDVPLRETVNRARLAAQLRARARVHDLAPRDARLTFRGVTPVVRRPLVGLRIDLPRARRVTERAILTRARNSFPLPARRVRPAVTAVGPAIIIERDRFRLTLWRPSGRRTFPIAVGQPAFPTPAGSFRIITKQRNPTWFPPSSPWARGLGPVPPGVNNPLGTRWMGTSAPAIGIHGTPVPSSIGTRASHGCIRMYIRDAEWLYDRISIGTPVIIR